MKIAIKTQTARATNYKEGLNCVNLFLINTTNTTFEMGLQITQWGETKPIEPIARIEIDGKCYRYSIPELKAKLES